MLSDLGKKRVTGMIMMGEVTWSVTEVVTMALKLGEGEEEGEVVVAVLAGA